MIKKFYSLFFLQQSYDLVYKTMFFLLMFIFLKKYEAIWHIAIANIIVYGLRYLGIKRFQHLWRTYSKKQLLVTQLLSYVFLFLAAVVFFHGRSDASFLGLLACSVILETLAQLGISSYILSQCPQSIATRIASLIALLSLILPPAAQFGTILIFPFNHIISMCILAFINFFIVIFIITHLWRTSFQLSNKAPAPPPSQTKHTNPSQLNANLSKVVLFSFSYSFILGAIDLLFPAWLLLAFTNPMRVMVLFAAIVGFACGFIFLNTNRLSLANKAYPSILLLQSLILMGAGIQYFEQRYLILVPGVLIFSFCLYAIQHKKFRILVNATNQDSRAPFFVTLCQADTKGMILAMLVSPLFIDFVIEPIMKNPSLALLRPYLGTGYERLIAITIGFLGWIMLLLLFAWRKNICSLDET